MEYSASSICFAKNGIQAMVRGNKEPFNPMLVPMIKRVIPVNAVNKIIAGIERNAFTIFDKME